MNFDSFRAKWQPEIEKKLQLFLTDSAKQGTALSAEMTAYHLETGGKRLRALIPPYVYSVFGKSPIDAVALGAAVEMIHNATLVHDDLQDGDEMRRNRPTVWKKYSAAQAINCGDAMFQYAFRLLLQMNIAPDHLVKLMDRAATGTLNVIEGQAQEFMMKEERYPGVDRYVGVIRGKTSGLFALPVVGAMEALGLDTKLCLAAERASMDLGMLFQIQDDLLDVYGNKGRDRVATDVAEGKVSILVAYVNESGTTSEKEELSTILKTPREKTSDADIQRAIAIFERCDAKNKSIRFIRKIQDDIKNDAELRHSPEIQNVLLELSDLFLEPLNGIL